MRNLEKYCYIGESIQLLQAKGEGVHVPLWFKVVDWAVAILFVSAYLFAAFKLIQWLLLKI